MLTCLRASGLVRVDRYRNHDPDISDRDNSSRCYAYRRRLVQGEEVPRLSSGPDWRLVRSVRQPGGIRIDNLERWIKLPLVLIDFCGGGMNWRRLTCVETFFLPSGGPVPRSGFHHGNDPQGALAAQPKPLNYSAPPSDR